MLVWSQLKSFCGLALALALSALALSGCAGASADLNAKLPDGTSFGRAVFQATTGGICVNTLVSFSRADGKGGYKPVKTGIINHGLIAHTAIGHVDLPPGKYHIAGASCITARHSNIIFAGKTDGRVGFFKSPKVLITLGTVEVRAGEVVDIGSLSFIRIYSDYRRFDSVMIVGPNSTKDINKLRASNPSLGAKLVTRHAKSFAIAQDLAATEARLSSLTPHGMNALIVGLQLALLRRALRAAGGGGVGSSVGGGRSVGGVAANVQ